MTSLTLEPGDLRDLVGRVLPFAGTDTFLPALAAVVLESGSGQLTATATDRYVVGVSKIDKQDLPDFTFSISAAHWKEVLRLYPAPRKISTPLPITLTVDGEWLTTSRPGAVPEVTARFPLVSHNHTSSIKKMMARHLAQENAVERPTTYNPRYLARFAHLGESLTVVPSEPHRPTLILAHNFAGAVMPMRLASSVGGDTPDQVTVKAREEWKAAFGELQDEGVAA